MPLEGKRLREARRLRWMSNPKTAMLMSYDSSMKWRGVSESDAESSKATLREELDERRLNMRRFVPKATQAINDRVVEELKASGAMNRALKVGDRAPEFVLPDVNGNPVSSTELLTRGPLIVTFLRGRWCPFDCATVEAWRDHFSAVRARGTSLVAISPMLPKQADFMRDQHKLLFPILSDAGNKVAELYGIAYKLPEYQQELFKTVFINLPFINGDESWTLPMPGTFCIKAPDAARAQAASTTFSFVDPDYTLRAEPAEVIQTL